VGKHDPFSLVGTTIDGKVRVLSVVGEGGFGVVYRGVHLGFEAPVAVKCLKLPEGLGPDEREALVGQLRDEGRLLLRLSQRTPGIVQALDVGALTTSEGARVPYLVLEWLEGKTLADELAARRRAGEHGMTWIEAFALLEPAARALGVAHAEGVAHRDVKPENLFLVRARGAATLKVLDFGIAKVLADTTSAADAVTGAAPGSVTPAYGAPEQFDKRRGASGPWTDVFALALVWVELVSGRRALVADDLVGYYRASSDLDHRPTLRALGAPSTDALEAALLRALAVDPKARTPDATTFWAELSAALAGEPAAERDAEHDALAATQAAELGDVERASFDGAPRAREDEPSDAEGEPLAEPEPSAEGPPLTKGAGARLASARVSARGSQRGSARASEREAEADLDEPARVTTRGAVSTSQRAPASVAAPRRGSLAALGAITLVAVGLGLWGARRLGRESEPTGHVASASASAARAPSSGAAAPVSKVPEAASLFSEGLSAWRGGAPDDAVHTLEEAVSRDRELAAAHLRLALWKFGKKPVAAREHYDLALRHRATLSQGDAALLDALAPYLREPWDLEDYERRLEAQSRARPDDLELLIYLGGARLKRLRFSAALEAFDAALSRDQSAVAAWVLKAESLSMLGDHQGQLAAYERCLERAPRALECQLQKIGLHGRLGHCAAMRDEAKRLLSMNPSSSLTQKQLAMSLYATGADEESVLLALERGWSFRPDGERTITELGDRAVVATLKGDFEAAAKHLKAWQREVASRPDQDSHAFPTLELAKLYREQGAPALAADAVAELDKRMSAYTEPALTDWEIALLPFAYRAGRLTREALDVRRAAWAARFRAKWKAAGRRLDLELDWMIWASAHGAFVESEAEAREALGAMPKSCRPSSRRASGRASTST
jgi:tetratricopeptide (TPR) repeat protein